MLKLTKKADYALMAMKHLAENADRGARSAKDVADSYGIPPEALAKILQRLAKAGLLHSQHGTNGGDRCNIREPLRKVNESIEAVLKRIKVSHMREEPEEAASEAPKQAALVTIT